MVLLKSFTMPTETYSASISPDLSSFVTGGEDFKIYKYSYEDGRELGNYCKSLACVCFLIFNATLH